MLSTFHNDHAVVANLYELRFWTLSQNKSFLMKTNFHSAKNCFFRAVILDDSKFATSAAVDCSTASRGRSRFCRNVCADC